MVESYLQWGEAKQTGTDSLFSNFSFDTIIERSNDPDWMVFIKMNIIMIILEKSDK